MARPVIIGNGGLTVGLDEFGLVHDFYYPYVGQENLTTARSNPHMLGVWVDGDFSWVGEDEWEISVNFSDQELVSDIVMKHEKLGIELRCKDFVDSDHDVFARKIQVRNLLDSPRSVRLFFHQVFQISKEGRADTVMYVPDDHYILDYKGRCVLAAYAETDDGRPFDQYSCGNAGIEGKEGTFKDAEDGELSMSAVEHGGVDSTIRMSLKLDGNSERYVHYVLAASDSQAGLNDLLNMYRGAGFQLRMEATIVKWHDWLSIASSHLFGIDAHNRSMLNKSLMVIKAHTDKHGGIIASCDSSIYNYGRDYYSYVWPRDGAWVLWPLIKLGYQDEAKKFFRFCQSIMHRDGYLLHKYQPDRSIGSTWHPLVHGKTKELAIQEDETAIVIWLLGEFYSYTKNKEFITEMYNTLVKPAADFMLRFIDDETGLPHASYDLWEEKFLTSTYTVAVTAKALDVAADMADLRQELYDADRWRNGAESIRNHAKNLVNNEGSFMKGFLLQGSEIKVDNVIDVSSLYGAWRWNFGSKSQIDKSIITAEETLLNQSPSGGSPRYENDAYFRSEPAHKGNPWFVTTLWLAQIFAAEDRLDDAKNLLEWAVHNACDSGVLSEQLNPETSAVVGVTPLVWSHAELINTILDVSNQS